ncbi:IS3 family transposase [Spiroplasma sp. SV19]|nr:IS3 family transposase [Spiroplasma sp. SV19]
MKFIKDHTKYFSINLLCEAIGITRSNYYRYLQAKNSLIKADEGIITLIQNEKLNNKFLSSYGIRRWKIYLFKKFNLAVNKKRLQRIFKEHRIIPFYWKNRSRHIKKLLSQTNKKNLLKRKFKQLKPNQAWSTDVTVIKHKHTEKSNLISFIDLTTRKVIAYTISDSMTTSVLINTLLKAIATVSNKKDLKKLIIHSDQDSIYTTTEYIEFCRKYKFKISYSAITTPVDNAVQESFHTRLKFETFYNN